MSQCERCLNAVPALSACGKKMKDWEWPDDHECLMDMQDFPNAADCAEAIELCPGEALSLND